MYDRPGTIHFCAAKAQLWGGSACCRFCGSLTADGVCGPNSCYYRHDRNRLPQGLVCYMCHVPARYPACSRAHGNNPHHPDVVRDIIVTLGRNASLQKQFVTWLTSGVLAGYVRPPPHLSADQAAAAGAPLDNSALRGFYDWCFERATDPPRNPNVVFVVAFADAASTQLKCLPPWSALLSATAAAANVGPICGGPSVLLHLDSVLVGHPLRCVFCGRVDCPLLNKWDDARLRACERLWALLAGVREGQTDRCAR